MKMSRIRCFLVMLLLTLGAAVIKPETAYAGEATVTFGSNYYRATDNEEFPIGVYIEGDAQIGEFEVEVFYDNKRLAYLGGGDSEQDGVITLRGTGVRNQVKYMLRFQTLSGGTAEVGIKSAAIKTADAENPEELEVAELIKTAVYIEGEDIVAASGEENSEDIDADGGADTEETAFSTDIPLAGETLIEEQKYYIVDLSEYLPEELDWRYRTVNGRYGEQLVTWLTNEEQSVLFLYLMDEQENRYLYAYSGDKNRLYPCNTTTVNGTKYYFMSPYVCDEWPEGLTLDIIQQESIVYAMDLSGQCDFYKLGTGRHFQLWNEEEGEATIYSQMLKLIVILVVTVLLITIATGIAVYLDRGRRQREKAVKAPAYEEDFVEDLSLEVTREEILAWRREALETAEKGAPVIAVQNVTMKFRVAMSNVSGIKEYIIQLLKKQISYRELLALDHINFNVYKGEVVGVIGTNGSGKSTLLKIVSGALKPTGGKVEVDRKKVQLLTLGTGFDMELTAKENIYLNGAIIGYSKEFIDEKYEEIVEFAELDGFMEEKVKNFSSGMVSRLGFAIATAGDAAEILILDEVLSVGDEFFRKKSLARIKEMIHGGSTVLLVSHSMGTILENCTKVVWIEKGVLKMVGEPKEVCEAYRKMYT